MDINFLKKIFTISTFKDIERFYCEYHGIKNPTNLNDERMSLLHFEEMIIAANSRNSLKIVSDIETYFNTDILKIKPGISSKRLDYFESELIRKNNDK